MTLRGAWTIGIATGLALGFAGGTAHAQGAALQPIPTAECQQFAGQIQAAVGFAMSASEGDFTDLTDNSDGRSCHIQGSASGQSYAAPSELAGKIAPVFANWREDPARAADGPDGTEKGLVNGNQIATIQVSWEPGPGAACSDKQPLSACNIAPQQKLWTAIVDIVVKGGR